VASKNQSRREDRVETLNGSTKYETTTGAEALTVKWQHVERGALAYKPVNLNLNNLRGRSIERGRLWEFVDPFCGWMEWNGESAVSRPTRQNCGLAAMPFWSC
jgi:hypothetical protein